MDYNYIISSYYLKTKYLLDVCNQINKERFKGSLSIFEERDVIYVRISPRETIKFWLKTDNKKIIESPLETHSELSKWIYSVYCNFLGITFKGHIERNLDGFIIKPSGNYFPSYKTWLRVKYKNKNWLYKIFKIFSESREASKINKKLIEMVGK
jgi:hypothetical protein